MQTVASGLLVALLAACGGGQGPGAVQPGEQGHDEDGHPSPAQVRHGAGHPGAEHAGDGPHAGHHHDFSDAERWAAIFDDPARDEWQRPQEVVELLGPQPGMTVVDLGAGTGYFLPHLALAVGEGGRVLALDVEPEMVEHMQQRVEQAELSHVEPRVASSDDPGLPAGSVDRVLIVNTWHHISDRIQYGRKLHRALRAGGSVLVVDFTLESEHGPPREMRMGPEAVVDELRAAGFEAAIADEELPMQYAVRATKGP